MANIKTELTAVVIFLLNALADAQFSQVLDPALKRAIIQERDRLAGGR